MLAEDGILFVAMGSGIEIFDLTGDDGVPELISVVDDDARQLALASGKRLCALAGDRLNVIDVSRPEAPIVLSKERLPVFAEGITAATDLVYIAAGEHGLWILDLAVAPGRRVIGSVDTPDIAASVILAGNVACVGGAGMWMIDVGDPSSPQLIGALDGVTAVSMQIEGQLVFACGGGRFLGEDLVAVDISNPSKPALRSHHRGGYDLAVRDNRVYVIGFQLQVLNFLNPTSPILVANHEIEADHVVLYQDRLYLARYERNAGRIDVVNTSNPRPPNPLAVIDVNTYTGKLAVRDQEGFLCTENGLLTFDLAGAIPTISRRMNIAGATAIALDGTLGYVTTRSGGLRIVDIAAASPFALGAIDLPNAPTGVATDDGLVYLSLGGYGLWIVDASDPSHCQLLGSVDTPGDALDVAVQGQFAYVTDRYAGLIVVDVSNPASPYLAATVPFDGAAAIEIADGLAYVTGHLGFGVFDVTNRKPELRAMLDRVGDGEDIVLDGDLAYVAGRGVQVIDVSLPFSPVLLGLAGAGFATGIALDPTRVLVAAEGRLIVFPRHCADDVASRSR